jgi:nucleoid-associated protein YgaU
MENYKVKNGETLWDIAKRTLPDMDTHDAVVKLFDLNWEPLARRFWLPAGVDLRMPAEFDPSGNEPFDPSAVTPKGKR